MEHGLCRIAARTLRRRTTRPGQPSFGKEALRKKELEERMLKGFRDFILRGNVVDLAVAVIIGAAFNAIVTSLVGDVLNPLIAATIGKPDFSSVVLHVGGGQIKVGNFFNAIVSFLIVASVVYFAIVLPMNTVMARMKRGE